MEDLVLRILEATRKAEGHGKLAPNWKGYYRVTKVIKTNAYHLEDLFSKCLPRT